MFSANRNPKSAIRHLTSYSNPIIIHSSSQSFYIEFPPTIFLFLLATRHFVTVNVITMSSIVHHTNKENSRARSLMASSSLSSSTNIKSQPRRGGAEASAALKRNNRGYLLKEAPTPLSTKLQLMVKESDNRRDRDIQYLLQAVHELKERDDQRQLEVEELKENVDNLIEDNEELRGDNDRLAKKVSKCEPRRSKRLKLGGLGISIGTRSSKSSKKK